MHSVNYGIDVRKRRVLTWLGRAWCKDEEIEMPHIEHHHLVCGINADMISTI